ncbi:Crp/Fnr family transcriptional regulator [uncultured Pseudoflavonifractor sp.]|uniref:Crp/Fnr family transcriptional regulator n=1 Tax=uncultured Pseudoflavonifractor sp. TaxID=1221379 RepID=UPI0025FFEF67|nr:Crp/Fnr family transcriptional regulator [uncultured Pseudoflavonifractor sp.]
MGENKRDIWRPLAEGRPPQIYEPGRLIYLQDTQAEQFYYILSGTVKCFLSSGAGSERTLTLHHSGELIGEAAFFDRQPRVSSAVAVTRCELVSVDRQHLSDVFSRHPDMAVSMLEYLARTVRLLSVHVDGTLLQADQRIARYLLRLTPEADGTIHCTHEEIGEAVGVSRVTVSRVLGDLAKTGAVSTGYRTLKIIDKATLHRMAEADGR